MTEFPTVVLDSCVLIPSRLRDYLLSLAAERCYRPVWNDVILAELAWKEQQRHQAFGLSRTEARRIAAGLIEQMTSVFNDSTIDGWERLDGTLGLPDINDEQVLATAITANASMIVTSNLAHFPASAMTGSIQVVSPQDFTARIAGMLPGPAITALCQMAARLRKPVMSPTALLDYFDSHYQMHETTAILRTWLPESDSARLT